MTFLARIRDNCDFDSEKKLKDVINEIDEYEMYFALDSCLFVNKHFCLFKSSITFIKWI